MNIVEQIYREAATLPDHLAQEVLDFIGYLETKYAFKPQEEEKDLMTAQVAAMRHVWDNPMDDEVWNDL